MKKVLIIGAKGMLGQELVRVFLTDNDYEVIAWDRGEIDITNEAQAGDKISELAPKIIINAAAYNAVDKCEEPAEFDLAKKINGLAPGYLAKIAKNLGAVFVHYSTGYVFDGQKRDGYKENDEVSPVSNYGISKALGEKEVFAKGGKYYIIRLQKLFGKPAMGVGAKKSFFEIMLALAEKRKEFDMIDEELGNFTFAPDLAERTKHIVENNLLHGVYHVINEGRPVTWFGAAKVLFKLTGHDDIKLNPVVPEKFPRPAKRPKYCVLLNTKLPALRSWEEALEEFINLQLIL